MFFEFVELREMRGCFGPTELFPGGDVENLTPEAAIAQQRVDVVIGREAPMAKLLPVEDRMFGPPLGIKRVGILDKGWVARVE